MSAVILHSGLYKAAKVAKCPSVSCSYWVPSFRMCVYSVCVCFTDGNGKGGRVGWGDGGSCLQFRQLSWLSRQGGLFAGICTGSPLPPTANSPFSWPRSPRPPQHYARGLPHDAAFEPTKRGVLVTSEARSIAVGKYFPKVITTNDLIFHAGCSASMHVTPLPHKPPRVQCCTCAWVLPVRGAGL